MVPEHYPEDATAEEKALFEQHFDEALRPGYRHSDRAYTPNCYIFEGDYYDCPGQAAAVGAMFLVWRRGRCL